MSKKPAKRKASKEPAADERDREAVLADFRKIAGPLRAQNRDQKPKS